MYEHKSNVRMAGARRMALRVSPGASRKPAPAAWAASAASLVNPVAAELIPLP